MSEIKVGDKVKMSRVGHFDTNFVNIGDILTVISVDEDGDYRVEFTKDGKLYKNYILYKNQVEKVEDEKSDTSISPTGSLRYNGGKAELHQVPSSLLIGVAKVLMYGEQKYEKGNWRKGIDWSVPYDCMMRHMLKWLDGETLDDESGLPHLYHAAANIAMLIEYSETHKNLDNRYNGPINSYNQSFEGYKTNEYKKALNTPLKGSE